MCDNCSAETLAQELTVKLHADGSLKRITAADLYYLDLPDGSGTHECILVAVQ